jgi:hypothetical protein
VKLGIPAFLAGILSTLISSNHEGVLPNPYQHSLEGLGYPVPEPVKVVDFAGNPQKPQVFCPRKTLEYLPRFRVDWEGRTTGDYSGPGHWCGIRPKKLLPDEERGDI